MGKIVFIFILLCLNHPHQTIKIRILDQRDNQIPHLTLNIRYGDSAFEDTTNFQGEIELKRRKVCECQESAFSGKYELRQVLAYSSHGDSISIYDITGREIPIKGRVLGPGPGILNFSLSPGVYFLKMDGHVYKFLHLKGVKSPYLLLKPSDNLPCKVHFRFDSHSEVFLVTPEETTLVVGCLDSVITVKVVKSNVGVQKGRPVDKDFKSRKIVFIYPTPRNNAYILRNTVTIRSRIKDEHLDNVGILWDSMNIRLDRQEILNFYSGSNFVDKINCVLDAQKAILYTNPSDMNLLLSYSFEN